MAILLHDFRFWRPRLPFFEHPWRLRHHRRPNAHLVAVVADAVVTHDAPLVTAILINARPGRGCHNRATAALGALKHSRRWLDALDAAQQLFRGRLLSGWNDG